MREKIECNLYLISRGKVKKLLENMVLKIKKEITYDKILFFLYNLEQSK